MMSVRAGLIRRVELGFVAVWMVGCAATVVGQKGLPDGVDPDAVGPAFEVAVVRPTGTVDRGWSGTRLDPSGRYEASKVTVTSLFWDAYGSGAGRKNVIVDHDAPKWVDEQQFDVNAKVDVAAIPGWEKLSDQERMDVLRPMLRRLLADRFKARYRVEMRKTPVYALVQAKGGAHVKEAPAPVKMEGDPDRAMTKYLAEHPGKGPPGGWSCGGETCVANAVKIGDLVGQIQGSSEADRMVVDETGLTGYYDLSFASYVPRGSDVSPMQKLEDDLGMRFEPRTIPIKTYVIVSAEKPGLDGD